MADSTILWLLDKLDIVHLQLAVKKRGWVCVPRKYAEQAWPKEVQSGWWPEIKAP